MRTAFIDELIRTARENDRIFLVVGDLGYSVVEPFAEEFSRRFLNAGVAEQNMTGMAAGLASEGYHVFIYSIANFPTFRCAEQIRNDVAYHQFPVTIVSVGGGLAYGSLGYSHHAVQDLALMRSFPGMLIACPGDPEETRACVRFLSAHPRPSYLRLGKAGEPVVHLRPCDLAVGKILCVQTGKQTVARNAVLSTGATLHFASTALSERDYQQGWALYSLPVWNEQARAAVEQFVAAHDYVITMEDHLRAGGFGSFVQECLDDQPALLTRVRCLALTSAVCDQVASQVVLNRLGGLNHDNFRRLVDGGMPQSLG